MRTEDALFMVDKLEEGADISVVVMVWVLVAMLNSTKKRKISNDGRFTVHQKMKSLIIGPMGILQAQIELAMLWAL